MNIFSEIKAKLAILDVVNEYTTLKRAGVYFKGLCPIHQEKTASFFVTPHKGIFYCFSCHVGGDLIAFVAAMERCSPLEAARLMAQRHSIPIALDGKPESADAVRSEWSLQQRHATLCGLIAQFCHEQLFESGGAAAAHYLAERALTRQSIDTFILGYLPSGERARKRLLAFIQKSGFMANDLLDTKFMLAHKQGLYSPFEERIIFPIHDHMERSCGFGGRVFRAGDDRPKYYNSHDSLHFNKSTLLFGFHKAKRAMQKTNTVSIAEGYMDCIALTQAGLTNSVATLGTACTAEHVKLLARYVNTLNVVYDGDKAGLDATMRLGEMCWQQELDVYVTELPRGEDPASYLAHNAESWNMLPRRDIFGFYVHTLEKQFHTHQSLTEKLQSIRAILERIQRIEDSLKRNVLLQQVAGACNIPLATLQRALQPTPSRPAIAAFTPQKKQRAINKFAKSLLCAILSEGHLFSSGDEAIISRLLPLRLRILFEKLQHYLQHYKGNGATSPYLFSDFFGTLTIQEQEYIARTLMEHESQTVPPLEMLLEQCRVRFWKDAVRELQHKIATAQDTHNHEQLTKLMQEFHHLKSSILHKGII